MPLSKLHLIAGNDTGFSMGDFNSRSIMEASFSLVPVPVYSAFQCLRLLKALSGSIRAPKSWPRQASENLLITSR